MTIGRKLVFASVISFALFALLAFTGWVGYQSVMRSSKAAGALERESMCLQMLFRGVNETLLTSGTPYSIEITRSALRCFDDAHALAMASEPDEAVRREMIERVGLRWESIRGRLDPYLKENLVSHEDPARMAEYGSMLAEGESLVSEVEALSAAAARRVEDTARQTGNYVVIITLLIVISMVSLHTDLFRSIAVPVRRLRLLMSEISGKAEKGEMKGEEAVLLSERLGPVERRLSGRVRDISELVSSFDTMITAVNGHMDRRRAMEGRLRKLASIDELTQAFNRSRTDEIMARETERALRQRHPLSLIMFDIDRFKLINDSFGHLTGDDVLRTVAAMTRENIRETDSLIRWGGEEFLIVSPEMDIEQAMTVAERLRAVMGGHAFEYMGPVTASFGVAEYREGESKDSFIMRVDNALCAAKRTRNKVEQAA